MEILFLSDKQFKQICKILPDAGNAEKIPARTALDCAIWVIIGGRTWKEIPEKYGKYDTIRKRFARWSKSGIFRKIFYLMAGKAKKRCQAMLDSTTVKAHRTAASMKNDDQVREIGRSAGGLTTKIHLLASTERIPLDFSLSPGQASDSKKGEELLRKNKNNFKMLLADKAYDTDKIRNFLKEEKKNVCIPPKSNRKNPPDFDSSLYKTRSVIEIMFGRLKDWRGIAMRYCRSAHIFDSFVCMALYFIFSDVH